MEMEARPVRVEARLAWKSWTALSMRVLSWTKGSFNAGMLAITEGAIVLPSFRCGFKSNIVNRARAARQTETVKMDDSTAQSPAGLQQKSRSGERPFLSI